MVRNPTRITIAPHSSARCQPSPDASRALALNASLASSAPSLGRRRAHREHDVARRARGRSSARSPRADPPARSTNRPAPRRRLPAPGIAPRRASRSSGASSPSVTSSSSRSKRVAANADQHRARIAGRARQPSSRDHALVLAFEPSAQLERTIEVRHRDLERELIGGGRRRRRRQRPRPRRRRASAVPRLASASVSCAAPRSSR